MKRFFKKPWAKIILGFFGFIFILATVFYFAYQPPKEIGWGLNFSPDLAAYLGYKPRDLFVKILDEMHPKYIRLPAYWENLEANQGKFDLASTDAKFMLDQAAQHNVKVILVLGHKQPRWPECHHPSWYEQLSPGQKEDALLNVIRKAVDYFKIFPALEMWQVENEPYFNYGQGCPVISSDFLKAEIKLVKSLDSRPVVVTDSGEKSTWLPAAYAGADVLGSTLYREVYYESKKKYVTYPIPAFVYRVKAGMVRLLSGTNRVMGVELQAEPWFNGGLKETPWTEQAKLMNPDIFYANINYAKNTGLEREYFWGVEWWYWAKSQGHSEMWSAAKEFFSKQ